MQKYIFEEKLYSDYQIIFNGSSFLVHIKLLSNFFSYFRSIGKKEFNEKNQLIINHHKINGDILEPIYFQNLLEFIYFNEEGKIIQFINDKHINDIVEYNILFNYFGYVGDLSFLKKLMEIKIDKLFLLKTDLLNIIESTNYSKKNSNPKKSNIVYICPKQIEIDYRYLITLLDFFNEKSEEFKFNLVSMASLDITDIIKLEKKYQKIAMISCCFPNLTKLEDDNKKSSKIICDYSDVSLDDE